MFDLKLEINRWRTAVAAEGPCREQDLVELESHLREEVEALVGTGLREREAFLVASTRLGHPAAIGAEFAKAYPLRRWCRQLVVPVLSVPALAVGLFASIYLLPKAEEVWARAGFVAGPSWPLDTSRLILQNLHLGLAAAVAVIAWVGWRASAGTGRGQLAAGAVVFAVNSAVLVALAGLFIAVVLAAPR
jgi:hypothetical protein